MIPDRNSFDPFGNEELYKNNEELYENNELKTEEKSLGTLELHTNEQREQIAVTVKRVDTVAVSSIFGKQADNPTEASKEDLVLAKQFITEWGITESKLAKAGIKETKENRELFGKTKNADKAVLNQAKILFDVKQEFHTVIVLKENSAGRFNVDDEQHKMMLMNKNVARWKVGDKGKPKLHVGNEAMKEKALKLHFKDEHGNSIRLKKDDIEVMGEEDLDQLIGQIKRYDREKENLLKLIEKRDALFADLQHFEQRKAEEKESSLSKLSNRFSNSLIIQNRETVQKTESIPRRLKEQLSVKELPSLVGKLVQIIKLKIQSSSLRNKTNQKHEEAEKKFHNDMKHVNENKDLNRDTRIDELKKRDQKLDS